MARCLAQARFIIGALAVALLLAIVAPAAAQGASVQCMQAIEIERSPGLPSLIVTTRRRLMPHGTSCSFLQAVTQALHSMQRSASQRNFMRAMF